MFCNQCGHELEAGSVFCTCCGTKAGQPSDAQSDSETVSQKAAGIAAEQTDEDSETSPNSFKQAMDDTKKKSCIRLRTIILVTLASLLLSGIAYAAYRFYDEVIAQQGDLAGTVGDIVSGLGALGADGTPATDTENYDYVWVMKSMRSVRDDGFLGYREWTSVQYDNTGQPSSMKASAQWGLGVDVTFANDGIRLTQYDADVIWRPIDLRIDFADFTRTYAYDDYGHLVSNSQNSRDTETYAYDEAGRLISLIDTSPEEEYLFSYDGEGRLVYIVCTAKTAKSSRTMTYAYNESGQIDRCDVAYTNGTPEGALISTVFKYDAAGNLVKSESLDTNGKTQVITMSYEQQRVAKGRYTPSSFANPGVIYIDPASDIESEMPLAEETARILSAQPSLGWIDRSGRE